MKSFVTALVLLGFFTISAHAQSQVQLAVGDIDVGKLKPEVQQTPQFEAGGVKGKDVPNPRDWLEVEVEFEVKGREENVVPELLFRYYIGFVDQSGQGRTLTGDVKHVNIVPGEKYYSVVYVAPSVLGNITGDYRRFQESAVKAMGVEVYYNGVIVGGESTMSGTNAKFWTKTATQPGVLSKPDTPFALLWIDRYAEIAKGNR